MFNWTRVPVSSARLALIRSASPPWGPITMPGRADQMSTRTQSRARPISIREMSAGSEWDAVRAALPGGEHVPSGVIRARTRQAARFAAAHGRLPASVFELEGPPATAPMLILAACDRQQTSIERHPADPRRALLRIQLPLRPDPRSYRDWSWVAVPLILPPTVPTGAVLHLPTLRVTGDRVRADVSFTCQVPRARRVGHTVAVGVDWGLNTLLSAGAVRQGPDGVFTALGAGAQYRAGGVLAKSARLRRHSARLQARHDHYQRLISGDPSHPLTGKAARLAGEAAGVAARRLNLNDALAWSAAVGAPIRPSRPARPSSTSKTCAPSKRMLGDRLRFAQRPPALESARQLLSWAPGVGGVSGVRQEN